MFVTDTLDNGSYKTLKIESEAVSMRIDAYNAVSQIYKTSSYSKNIRLLLIRKRMTSMRFQIQLSCIR